MSLLLGVPTDPTGIDQTSDRTKDRSRQDLLSICICSALHSAWPRVSAQRMFDGRVNERWAYPRGVLVNAEHQLSEDKISQSVVCGTNAPPMATFNSYM